MGNKFRLLLVGFAHVCIRGFHCTLVLTTQYVHFVFGMPHTYSTNNSAWQLSSEPRPSYVKNCGVLTGHASIFLLIKAWWLNHRKYLKNSCLSHWLDFIKHHHCMNFCLGFGQNFQQFQWIATHVCHSILMHLVLVALGEKPLPYAHVLEVLVPSGWGFLKEIIDWGCSYPCFPPGQSWDCGSPSQEEVTSGSLDHMTSGPGPEAPAKQLPRRVVSHPASLSVFIFILPRGSQTPHSSIFFKCLLLGSLAQESWSPEQSIWNFTCSDHEIVARDHLFRFSELHRVRNYKPRTGL